MKPNFPFRTNRNRGSADLSRMPQTGAEIEQACTMDAKAKIAAADAPRAPSRHARNRELTNLSISTLHIEINRNSAKPAEVRNSHAIGKPWASRRFRSWRAGRPGPLTTFLRPPTYVRQPVF